MRNQVIFTLLFMFLTQVCWAQLACRDIYDSRSLQEVLVSYPNARSEREAWELEQVGEIFTGSRLELAGSWLRSREGTYPLLILRSGELLISNRLPDHSIVEGEPYLATHRGLANNYRVETGREPDIIFAGEVRVTLGKVRSLIDMSGAYHFRLSDLFTGAKDADLIFENSVRLEFAARFLRDNGLLDVQSEVTNFWQRNYQIEPARRGNGHVLAKDAALFELRCFANPRCWNQFQRIEQFLIDIEVAGGFREVYLRRLKETGENLLLDHMNLIAEMPAEGVIEMMMRPSVQKKGWMDRLENDIPALRERLEL